MGLPPGVSYLLGFASALLLFASILLHELGHAVVARGHDVETEQIDCGCWAASRGLPAHPAARATSSPARSPGPP